MLPPKTLVVGTPISMTSYSEVVETLGQRPADRATVIAVCNVHSVMSARRNRELASALENADVATSDGVPLVWGIRWTARPEQERVYRPELMRRTIAGTVDRGWRHYFYGSSPETLSALETAFKEMATEARFVEIHSPPFRPLTDEETKAVSTEIHTALAPTSSG